MAVVAGMLGWLLPGAGCGAGQRPRGDEHELVAVQFVEASLTSTRPDGRPWHVSRGDGRGLAVLGGLIGLAVGDPTTGYALGSAISDPGGDALAPDPYVELKIGAETYRVQPTGPTLAPRWAQPIVLAPWRWPASEPATILVRDAVDEGVIAQHRTTVGELLGRDHHDLALVGGVASLEVVVRAMPPRHAMTYELVVPATVSLRSLTEGTSARAAAGWRAIPVWNGDAIHIVARGSVCPSSWDGDTFGPDGAPPGRWKSHNQDGFEDAPHAALVAVLPGQAEVVGQAATFTAQQSGWLLLFVNDTDVGNNSGGFEVDVTVSPPR
jgi:hypothetical protein